EGARRQRRARLGDRESRRCGAHPGSRPRQRPRARRAGPVDVPRPPSARAVKLANRRIRLLLFAFAFAFAAMFLRAAWLQAVRAQDFDRLAQGQHQGTGVDPGARGTIYDRGGVQLAIGRQATTVYANPREIDDPQAGALAAGKTLRLSSET